MLFIVRNIANTALSWLFKSSVYQDNSPTQKCRGYIPDGSVICFSYIVCIYFNQSIKKSLITYIKCVCMIVKYSTKNNLSTSNRKEI